MQSHIQCSQKGFSRIVALLMIMFILFAAGIVVSWKRLEGKAPEIKFSRDFKALGRKPVLAVSVHDPGSGLKSFRITLTQNNQSIPLVEEQFPGPKAFGLWEVGDQETKTFDLGKLIVEKHKIQDGSAVLEVSAGDYSLRHFFRGNRAQQKREFVFDIHPPRIDVVSAQHYINQGGSECVAYRVTSDAEVSGVQAGPHFFPSYPAGKDPNLRFSLFAFAYNMDPSSPLKIVARDAAGNESVAGFWYKLFQKKFRSADIQIEDNFLQKVVPDILSNSNEVKDQGDLLKNFIEINRNLRRINHSTITKVSEKSAPRFLWTGAFLQLSNSQVESSFADHRTYFYQGKEIDRQDHVGFDLSVVQHYPIEAANDGVVLYADYLGIYGNCVLIDHGYGLVSLYGHLSSIDVKPGQSVKKKQVLGRSGATGLAAGDHLHFGLFLDGVPVNPTEWWDGKWIQEHVMDRLKPPASSDTAAHM